MMLKAVIHFPHNFVSQTLSWTYLLTTVHFINKASKKTPSVYWVTNTYQT